MTWLLLIVVLLGAGLVLLALAVVIASIGHIPNKK